jgi:release factor glutamine methyltransferase
VTIGAALQQGSEMLERSGVAAARLTAEVLLRHALHCERAWLYAHSDEVLPERAWIHYGRYLDERLKGRPTQYITGIQEFYGRTFKVNRHVLIPRPETEHLVEVALTFLKKRKAPARVLDLGTGSGAIAITVALEAQQRVLASDISLDALQVAQTNARWLSAPVDFFGGNLLGAVRPHSVDLLLSNPPYVAEGDAAGLQSEVRDWEPHNALFAGASGLEIYRVLMEQARTALRPGGCLMVELGFNSLEGVRQLLGGPWREVEVIHDLAGWARVLVAEIL